MGGMPPPLRKVANKKLGNQVHGKLQQAPPDGYYCYYPELFDKPNRQIFTITRVTRNRNTNAPATTPATRKSQRASAKQ